MYLSSKFLGSGTVRQLAERVKAPLLVIGSDKFRRRDLATVECYNFLAAANLSAAIAALDVKDTRDLFTRVPPGALVLPRLGAIALAVLGAAFEAKGLGGAAPLESWVERHLAKDATAVSFHSLKRREHAEPPEVPTTLAQPSRQSRRARQKRATGPPITRRPTSRGLSQ